MYDVPGFKPVNEHFNGLAVAATVHFCDPPSTVASNDVIGDPVTGFGNVTAIAVVDSAAALTPERAVNSKQLGVKIIEVGMERGCIV